MKMSLLFLFFLLKWTLTQWCDPPGYSLTTLLASSGSLVNFTSGVSNYQFALCAEGGACGLNTTLVCEFPNLSMADSRLTYQWRDGSTVWAGPEEAFGLEVNGYQDGNCPISRTVNIVFICTEPEARWVSIDASCNTFLNWNSSLACVIPGGTSSTSTTSSTTSITGTGGTTTGMGEMTTSATETTGMTTSATETTGMTTSATGPTIGSGGKTGSEGTSDSDNSILGPILGSIAGALGLIFLVGLICLIFCILGCLVCFSILFTVGVVGIMILGIPVVLSVLSVLSISGLWVWRVGSKDELELDKIPSINSSESSRTIGSSESLCLTSNSDNLIPGEKFRQINREELVLNFKIGAGSFGQVFSGVWKHAQVAIKQVFAKPDQVENILDEARILDSVGNHPNVLRYLGIAIQRGKIQVEILFVMEFYEQGSLERFLKYNPGLDFDQKLQFSLEAAAGVAHLHTHRCVHRDIASRNFLVGLDNHLRVADFGMSRFLEQDQDGQTENEIGPFRWMAPEAIHKKKSSYASDVWSFGVLLWEIWTNGMLPYSDNTIMQVALGMAKNPRPKLSRLSDDSIQKLLDLIFKLNPKERPSMSQIISYLQTLMPCEISETFETSETSGISGTKSFDARHILSLSGKESTLSTGDCDFD